MSKKFNVTEGLRYKCEETFSSGGENRDHRLEFSALGDLARNPFWVMAT